MSHYSAFWRTLCMLLLLMWGTLALILTTQSDQVPLVNLVASTIGSTEFGATIGHAALFGALTGLGYLAFIPRWPARRALLVVMSLALPIAILTELHQVTVAGRSGSLADLLANCLGVFIAGFVLALRQWHTRTTIVR